MYDCLAPGAFRTPLDFNLPRRTDTVADALGPDPASCDSLPASEV